MHDKLDILSVGSDSSDTKFEEVEEPAQVEAPKVETPKVVEAPKVETPRLEKIDAKEVFCGVGRLAKALSDAGFRSEGIDWTGNKDKPVAKFCLMDLSSEWGQNKFGRKSKRI